MREELLEWIGKIYAGRRIKISGEAYLEHLFAVAEMAATIIPLGFEIGLCHDLLEDTPITGEHLNEAIVGFNYPSWEAAHIVQVVSELTDQFTSRDYPLLKKKERKRMEDERLVSISKNAQTVKYCDLIYNIQWTKRYQPAKAERYFRRKKTLLEKLDKGDERLRKLALSMTANYK